jgi:SHS2 domain-containing protein
MGFEELPHTADCALRVWAEDITALFVEAALGFNSVSGAQIGEGPRVACKITIQGTNAEELLVAFLTELTYFQEKEHLGFDMFQLQVSPTEISGSLEGAGLSSVLRPIKAVTFHNLDIIRTPRGHEALIVLDV